MDSINKAFNELLLERSFPLKQENIAGGIMYKGQMDFGTKTVPFAISLISEQDQGIAQLAFYSIAQCISEDQRIKWLHFINEWNDIYGTGYYLCLGRDNQVYMRYVLSVSAQSVEQIFRGVILGSTLVKQVVTEIEIQFSEN
ncbi:hypothetical protein JXA27_01710 [Aerococcaceae bacterium zg-B36]|uniref:hypothetical protein n=1 Tax=Aerococcaceae bacterium zg-252 TaxID=2796928 RepID=UPI001BD88D14|nr:hypothetical protein [Aerococcaceae bacterium zg-B36]